MVEPLKRVLTGIRPTGPLHLGHYAGALENWVKLQRQYDCYFLIADYQVSDYADDIARVRQAVWEVALDRLSVGLDPAVSQVSITAKPLGITGEMAEYEVARRLGVELTPARQAGQDASLPPLAGSSEATFATSRRRFLSARAE